MLYILGIVEENKMWHLTDMVRSKLWKCANETNEGGKLWAGDYVFARDGKIIGFCFEWPRRESSQRLTTCVHPVQIYHWHFTSRNCIAKYNAFLFYSGLALCAVVVRRILFLILSIFVTGWECGFISCTSEQFDIALFVCAWVSILCLHDSRDTIIILR